MTTKSNRDQPLVKKGQNHCAHRLSASSKVKTCTHIRHARSLHLGCWERDMILTEVKKISSCKKVLDPPLLPAGCICVCTMYVIKFAAINKAKNS